MSTHIATGLSYGTHPIVEHAAGAIRAAMEKAGITQAESVLLFMTPEYADEAEAALRLAARTAGCLNIAGCIGYGILTEEDWILDSPGIAAMVFGQGNIIAPHASADDAAALCFSTPQGFVPDWLHDPLPHIGGLTSDPLGQGNYKLWQGSRINPDAHVALGIEHVDAAFAVSKSFRTLTPPRLINSADGLDVVTLDQTPALEVLLDALPASISADGELPLHLLLGGVIFGHPDNAINEGRFHLDHIVSTNPETHSITLTSELQPGEHLFLAIRDTYAAEVDMQAAIDRATKKLKRKPDFGLLFPCLGRGPSFYGGRDRDIELLAENHPGMPFIGFYGNGEIGPLKGANHIYTYSAALGLFSVRPQRPAAKT
jgi:small ligand-binding sensory domain FIST